MPQPVDLWQSQWNAASWRAFLEVKESGSELAAIRLSTHRDARSAPRSLCTPWNGRHSDPWRHKSAAGDYRPSLTRDKASYVWMLSESILIKVRMASLPLGEIPSVPEKAVPEKAPAGRCRDGSR